ncbi:hypothetical protein B0T24DRAFT_489916, partial [Lasiosphaeria ovina]
WTFTHSFYAVMGGFAFDTSSFPRWFDPEIRQRLTITKDGIEYLLNQNPDLIPDISESSIKDKGKQNNFALVVIFGQVVWFCLQCISQLVLGLPVTVLELNTFAHGVCGLAALIAWRFKPLDVDKP